MICHATLISSPVSVCDIENCDTPATFLTNYLKKRKFLPCRFARELIWCTSYNLPYEKGTDRRASFNMSRYSIVVYKCACVFGGNECRYAGPVRLHVSLGQLCQATIEAFGRNKVGIRFVSEVAL